eukprot:Selendium_serpulae@DN6416_c1_g6_i1.p1
MESQLTFFQNTRDNRLKKFSLARFNGVGEVLLGQWVDAESGMLLGAAEVESMDPDYISRIRQQVERGDMTVELEEKKENAIFKRKKNELAELAEMLETVDEHDIEDFSWLSKVEILPNRGFDGLILDRYQEGPDGNAEDQMSSMQFADQIADIITKPRRGLQGVVVGAEGKPLDSGAKIHRFTVTFIMTVVLLLASI